MLSSELNNNSGAGVASVASSQSTPSAAATASPIATVGGGEGDSGENGKIPSLVANGASNNTISDANQATVNATVEGAEDEQTQTDLEPPPVSAKSVVQEEAPAINDSGGGDKKDGVKIKTTMQPEVDVEMISTEMIDGNQVQINSAKAKLKPMTTAEGGGGRRSRPTTPSKLEPKQPIDDDDDDDEYDIPPHLQKKQTIAETSPAERYIRFKEKLGSGAYKDVYRAYDTIEGIEVAWNVVKLGGVPKAERVRIVNEVRLLERLHHPNIISFHGSWVNRETERVIFVTEILSSGTLKSFVQKVQLIRWKIFKRWTIQILKGLEYLHSQDPPIIHRDLKCDNIFINGTSGDLRIGDFGLSTAISKKNQRWSNSSFSCLTHSNSQPLSVLGTPEFMAPELYDESYDEKVDIYAFGMLLLEIITRDVPYHECANPAQIYKKVTQGIPPASLRRVKSEDAKNFILFCLGIGKDASERPSATELLEHPFLEKKPDDETTIEVESAIEDIVIHEAVPETDSESCSELSKGGSGDVLAKGSKYSSIDGRGLPSRKSEDESLGNTSAPTSDDAPTPNGKEDQTEDQFDGMQQNEANMKKVTVLMGRGTTLDEDDSPIKDASPESQSNTSLQYKVSAVPRLDFVEGKEPYPSDAIDLALTLPDESRTTIEFEFDLVNDDPVQVAREMVTELEEVPDCAVLDISGAISGVAREARMKQNQWKKLQQQQSALAQQGMMMHNQSSMIPPQGMQAQPPQVQQQGMLMPQQQIYNPNSGYPSGSYSSGAALHHQQQIQPQQMGLVPPPISGEAATAPHPAPQQQMSILQQPPQQPPSHIQPPAPPVPPQQPTLSSTPDLSAQMKPAAPAMPTQQQQQHHPQQQLHAHQQQVPPPPQQPNLSSQSPIVRPNSMSALSNHALVQQMQQGTPMGGQPPPSLPPTDASIKISQSHNALHESLPVVKVQSDPAVLPMVHQDQSEHSASASASSVDASERRPSDGNPSEDLDVDSEVDAEEIRRLEEEFEKKLQRAKKSYGTRMDNLHRSKEEAEAQHQMTLEKHEKERIEFEKRVRLAEEEQTRRLNQLEKEFMEKKKEFMKAGGAPPSNTNNGEQIPPPGGHKRSSSHVMVARPSPDHKRNVSTSDMAETQNERERSDTMKGQLPPKLPSRTDLPPKFPKAARERSGSTQL
eukprot:scaffold652_cov142-Skeletonema_menzelii.AAC.6